MKKVKDFETWVNEDFAQLDTTPGMGDAVPPTSTTMGSGDQWPSLGIPYSHRSLKPKKKRKKRAKRKVNESEEYQTLYHATFKPLLKKIEAEGLGGKSSKKIWQDSKPGVVYLAKTPEIAYSYAETAFDDNENLPESWGEKIVVLEIDVDKLDNSKISIDTNVLDNNGDTVEYEGVIPWDFIKIDNSQY